MKTKVFFCLTFFLLTLCNLPLAGFSQTWSSITNGNWNVATTWVRVGAGAATPPTTLLSGMKVYVRHTVSWPTSLSSSLEILAGAELNIDRGILNVANGVSMKNWGRFTGNRGTLRQCVFIGCGNSGTPASGTWTTLEGGYTKMDSMAIEIAGDWVCSSGGLRTMTGTCLRTGQNFSVSGSTSRDTLKNAIIELGLHGSGNFQLSDAACVFDDARIWINSQNGGSGNIQFNSGSIRGSISAIKVNSASSAIIVSPSIGGSARLIYYCMPNPWNYSDPANKLYDKILDCSATSSITSNCIGSLLPVNFVLFTASVKNNFVKLEWETTDETDSKGFEVQRRDSRGWNTIGWVDARKNAHQIQQHRYSLTDTIAIAGTVSYRIRHLSKDGKEQFSRTQSLLVRYSQSVIYPGTGNQLYIVAGKKDPVKIYTFNMNGQKLSEKRVLSQSITIEKPRREPIIVTIQYADLSKENLLVPIY